MNKGIKITIFVQLFIVVFLLGIVLGMNIQKHRMKSDNDVTTEASDDNSDEKKDTTVDNTDNNTSKEDNNTNNDEDNKNDFETNHVVVERDVDYGSMDVPEPTTDDWLFTDGNQIVDAYGNPVWLTGINWFGYNTGTNTFDGLWASDLNQSIQEIANHGFNVIRIPFSAELILQWSRGEYPEANYNHAYNDYLNDMDSLQIFEYIIGQLTDLK